MANKARFQKGMLKLPVSKAIRSCNAHAFHPGRLHEQLG